MAQGHKRAIVNTTGREFCLIITQEDKIFNPLHSYITGLAPRYVLPVSLCVAVLAAQMLKEGCKLYLKFKV